MTEWLAVRPRRGLRAVMVAGAIFVSAVTTLGTGYLVAPSVALSRGLAYKTYNDATGLDQGLGDLEDRVHKNSMGGGGWMSPLAVDPLRRYILFVPPWRSDAGNSKAKYTAWGILDTAQEKVTASIRMPKATDNLLGFGLSSYGDDHGPVISDSGVLTWEVTCQAQVPDWWPKGGPGWPGRTTTRTEYVSFDTQTWVWARAIAKPEDADAQRAARRFNIVNHPQTIPGSQDELVAEHERPSDGPGRLVFRRLLRRNPADGSVLWQVGPEQFPDDALADGSHQILLPPMGLGAAASWCVLVDDWVVDRTGQRPRLWRLDLFDGRIKAIQLQAEPADEKFEVASDGQTVVYWDDAFELKESSASTMSTRGRFFQQSNLVAWHPDNEPRSLFETRENSHWFMALPAGRMLLVDSEGKDTGLRLKIIPLDGGPPRQIYP